MSKNKTETRISRNAENGKGEKNKSDYESQHPSTVLPPGKRAPDFTLRTTPDQCVELSELRGSPAILVFYPADWSPVCGDQLALYNELLPEFRRFNASLVAISVDGVWCHLAYAKERKLRFPLLSDFEPKGAVARTYGAYPLRKGSVSGHCSFSTRTARSNGVICPRLVSIPAPMASSKLSKSSIHEKR